MSNEIKHYGTPRHSGRYPWGSGDDPEQRNKSFLGQVEELKKKGLSEVDIAKGLGMTTSELRNKKSIAKDEQRKSDYVQALKWKNKGVSNVEIGKRLGNRNESYVRSLLNPAIQERSEITKTTANMLKDAVDKKGYIDVGAGVERHIGVSRTKLKTAISKLEEDGYLVAYIPVEQLGTGKKTTVMVLSKPKNKEAVEVVKLKNKGLSEADISKETGMSEEKVTSLLKETFSDIYKNQDKIHMVTDYSEDGGRSFLEVKPPKNVDSKRVQIRYHEDGGSDKDGVIELRRGVEDISLGDKHYAQVRIAVDGTHYLKGMAMYSDDIPNGVDIIYNTNKKKNIDKLGVMKVMAPDMTDPKAKEIQSLNISKDEKDRLLKKGVEDGSIKADPDNPFGAMVRQRHYIGKDGKEHLSALNAVGSKEGSGEEGSWETWSKNLPSQMLSKQSPSLAKKQLGLAYDAKKEEFDEIMSLNNPMVKRKLLESFADDCDSSAVHLKAAALPRQATHVILPLTDIKETEIYAPKYNNGESVVLIRFPHGGIFEIPELKVNNNNRQGKSLLGNDIKDAVGIHPKVAERLSGADFDGDNVLVIPNNNGAIKTSSPLKGLIGFDPKAMYKLPDDAPQMSSRTKGLKMGDVSNLITDMTIRGATNDEIARAVRHSMVVIDAEKHHLNYKQSYIDNGIAELKKKYQGSERSGASTLISRASSEIRVPHRENGKKVLNPETGKTKRVYVDPATGKKMYEYTGEIYIKRTKRKDGTIKETMLPSTIKSTKMAEAEDAFKLSSGTPMEAIYATHANRLKSLANESRKAAISIKPPSISPSARKAYAPEVASLMAKLNIALKNAPLERQAQLLANTIVSTKKANNPNMSGEELKKIKGMALAEARSRTKAGKQKIDITDREWEAIQAGGVSANVLTQILNNADPKRIKELATPRETKTLSTTKAAIARQRLASGFTIAEVADSLGVSTSLINKLK